jgi:hypothetical protein
MAAEHDARGRFGKGTEGALARDDRARRRPARREASSIRAGGSSIAGPQGRLDPAGLDRFFVALSASLDASMPSEIVLRREERLGASGRGVHGLDEAGLEATQIPLELAVEALERELLDLEILAGGSALSVTAREVDQRRLVEEAEERSLAQPHERSPQRGELSDRGSRQGTLVAHRGQQPQVRAHSSFVVALVGSE